MKVLRFFFVCLLSGGWIMTTMATENATFDSAGKLTSLIHDGRALDVRSEFVVVFEGGPAVGLQPHDQRSPVRREGSKLKWSGTKAFPNGREAQFVVEWNSDRAGKASLKGTLVHEGHGPLVVEGVDYVIDVPRPVFVGGTIEPMGVSLPRNRPDSVVLFRGETRELTFVDTDANWRLSLSLDADQTLTVTDYWDEHGRSYRVRVRLLSGDWAPGSSLRLGLSLAASGQAQAVLVSLAVDTGKPGHRFQGFGGNYCWGHESPVTDYTLENLQSVWTRHELKAFAWDRERESPGPELIDEFERIRRIHDQGIPFIVSAWRFPERYYADPHQKPRGSFGRKIAADRWGEVLDLIGTYLLHLKNNYGAEAAMFSFNEPDLGVDVGFSPEEHRDAIKRIGAHLENLGLKTKMLLGDTANPRDTHRYVLPTAADAEAMRYVAGVSFHSWGNGTPTQYAAWAEVADWLELPLFVGEGGVDPGAWRNRAFDSYSYGLREVEQTQNILRHAKPAVSLYWEFSDDYAVVRHDEVGNVIPTGRFWLMKHFTNLTPQNSRTLESASDQGEVLISAFAKDAAITVHVLNAGPAREATISGLPPGEWREVITTEDAGFREGVIEIPAGGLAPLPLPARSMVSLVKES